MYIIVLSVLFAEFMRLICRHKYTPTQTACKGTNNFAYCKHQVLFFCIFGIFSFFSGFLDVGVRDAVMVDGAEVVGEDTLDEFYVLQAERCLAEFAVSYLSAYHLLYHLGKSLFCDHTEAA